MNKVYDNGYKMIGKVENILNIMQESHNKGAIDVDFMQELSKELEYYEKSDIVLINYDNPMGFTIDEYWKEND